MTSAEERAIRDRANEGAELDRKDSAGEVEPTAIPERFSLGSLSSQYVGSQHSTYLRHLKEAISDPKNLNIALTGRYGTGKSSVLDQLEADNAKSSLRVAISTLGPNAEGATLTNRIQKELVKQLLYRAAPGELPFSRFNRIRPLSRKRAAGEAGAATLVLGALLALFGWLPDIAGSGDWRVLSWALVAALVAAAMTVVRLVVYGQFVVSDVSAAGTAVKLTQRTSTYFDEYLEEIVYFFDDRSPDLVIFEDLDRFDDPHIFEALRELNTLLNHTAHRHEKFDKEQSPLRFVYAIKDSLFEQLGADPDDAQDDAAESETVRANRTKFFDIVIPMVPFISHRNARELLEGVLESSKFTGIDRRLIALVAAHATDMRLLRNIANEYGVFAERLLMSSKVAPGLKPSNLFALVAYKNFHLEDFEDISRRSSDLDSLYDLRRDLVRHAILVKEAARRDLLKDRTRFASRKAVATRAGEKLYAVGMVLIRATGYTHVVFTLGGKGYGQADVKSPEFWVHLAEGEDLGIVASSEPTGGGQHITTLTRKDVLAVLPEAGDSARWAALDAAELQSKVDGVDRDLAFLRGADFEALARNARFTAPVQDARKVKAPEDETSPEVSFATLVDATLRSELARELVKQGYINRNFALYAAQFYGDFTGVDVANFVVQTVETNAMDIDYGFSGPAAISNLLVEAGEEFPRTISAYNIAVLDHLLETDDPRADDVVTSIVARFGDEARKFVSAYFNSGSSRESLAARLSDAGWSRIFEYLVGEESVPSDVRPLLVDAALGSAKSDRGYDLGDDLRDFIVEHFSQMNVFAASTSPKTVEEVVAICKSVGVMLPDLGGLNHNMRERLVELDLWQITADNLRYALNVTGDVSLDRVHANADVVNYCRRTPSDYLAAIDDDPATPHSVLSEATLIDTLTAVATSWSAEQVQQLISTAAPESRLTTIGDVPESSWPTLAESGLVQSTAGNVREYVVGIGELDESLARLLESAGTIDPGGADEDVQVEVALAVLNAVGEIPDPASRVSLISDLEVDGALVPAGIEPEAGDLLALLIERGVLDDSLEAFMRFRPAGWDTLNRAVLKSSAFGEFVTPELLADFVPEALGSDSVPPEVKDRVIANLASYVPNDDPRSLVAAGQYALQQGGTLPLAEIVRVTAYAHDANLTMSLIAMSSPMPAAPEVVQLLANLGAPYNYLVDRSVNEFEVAGGDAHRTVLEYLRDAGQLSEVRKKRSKDIFDVRLA